MSQGCGSIDYLNGGTMTGVSILNSQVTNTTISSSTLDSSTISNLTALDEKSAQVVADAIAALPADKLQALVNALLAALTPKAAPTPALSEESDAIPTDIIGARSSVLGDPDTWLALGEYVVPMYSPNK